MVIRKSVGGKKKKKGKERKGKERKGKDRKKKIVGLFCGRAAQSLPVSLRAHRQLEKVKWPQSKHARLRLFLQLDLFVTAKLISKYSVWVFARTSPVLAAAIS